MTLPTAEVSRLLALAKARYAEMSIKDAEAQWEHTARPDQRLPDGDWTSWLIQAGRGWGKTRTGSETVHEWVRDPVNHFIVPPHRLRGALVAATAADARDTMVEGVSGILATAPRGFVPNYEPSKRRLTWPNGAQATLFSAEKPRLLRGPEHHFAWCDEAAAWDKAQDTWDMLMFGLRAGDRPRVIITTTPQRTKFVRYLVKLSAQVITHGAMSDNADNLSPVFVEQITERYGGTRLGRQELEGELLEDREGALWTLDMIDALRVEESPELQRVVVAVDPSGGGGDEIGIVVVGSATVRNDEGKRVEHFYVMDDVSLLGSPGRWGRAAADAYHEWQADRLVGEKNYGGDMVESNIRTVDRNVSYKGVTASRGKAVRAEPIAALYEQGRVHHVGKFRELEDQMCEWAPGDDDSPDRMDALVWGLTELSQRGQWAVT